MYAISTKKGIRKHLASISRFVVLVIPLLLAAVFIGPTTAAASTHVTTTTAPAMKSPAAPPTFPPYDSAHMLKATVVKPDIVVYTVTSAGYLPAAHSCEVLGTDSLGAEGVQCADVYAEPSGNGGGIFIFPAVEHICQQDGDPFACDESQANYALYTQGLTARAYGLGQCSASGTPCADGRNYYIDWGGYYVVSSCDTDPNGPNAVWTVTYADSTYIVPTVYDYTPSANFGSNHVIACP